MPIRLGDTVYCAVLVSWPLGGARGAPAFIIKVQMLAIVLQKCFFLSNSSILIFCYQMSETHQHIQIYSNVMSLDCSVAQ